jgi:hypothetical protein
MKTPILPHIISEIKDNGDRVYMLVTTARRGSKPKI